MNGQFVPFGLCCNLCLLDCAATFAFWIVPQLSPFGLSHRFTIPDPPFLIESSSYLLAIVPGVDSPFFSTIVLFKIRSPFFGIPEVV